MNYLSTRFHDFIERYNILTEPTNSLAKFFEQNPTAEKIALFIDHLIRTAFMVGFMFIPQIPIYISMPLCFAGSMFYRLTVEKNCNYKFALPAFAGSIAISLAIPAISCFINGTALMSGISCSLASVALIPLPLYIIYVVFTVNYDVNQKQKHLQNSESPKIALNEVLTQEDHCQCSEKSML